MASSMTGKIMVCSSLFIASYASLIDCDDAQKLGYFVINEGAYYQMNEVEMRGINITNYGTISINMPYIDDSIFPLKGSLTNYGLVRFFVSIYLRFHHHLHI